MSDALKKLAELLEGAGAVMTFSAWCISGLVPDCKCRRCLQSRGEAVTEETEKAAKIRSRTESRAFRDRMWAEMDKLKKR